MRCAGTHTLTELGVPAQHSLLCEAGEGLERRLASVRAAVQMRALPLLQQLQ